MKKLFITVLFLSTFSGFAQKIANPEPYAKTITATDLKKHLYIIAGEEMQGRGTGTEGERRAAAYIENEFKRIGLTPGNNNSYQMYFPVYQDSLVNAVLEVNGNKFSLDKDFNVVMNNIPAMHGFSEVVFIPQQIAADSIKKMNLTGKLLMIAGETNMGGRTASARLEALRNANAAAVMFVTKNYPRQSAASRSGNLTRNFFRSAIGPQQFTISENIAKAIVGSMYDNAATFTRPVVAKANVLLDVQKATRVVQSSNVVGLIPGTDLKDEYLVISAHYDHEGIRDGKIYYGADDDGSGTVSVIEIAEAFAAAMKGGKGPRRSIVFLTVSGEEKGLWGSDYYGSNPIFPLDKTTANLNIDMIGRSDITRKGDTTNYVYVVGDDKLSSDLKPISEAQNKKYTKLDLDYKFNDPADVNRIYYRSDHYNFAKHGVPIIFYYDGMLGGDYHKPTDTPDKINYPLMTRRAQLVFYTAWEIANKNGMMKRDIPMDNSVFNR